MAAGDLRQIIQLRAGLDGEISVRELNDALRRICEMIYKQEGRSGRATIRDGLTINPSGDTPLAVENGDPSYSEINFGGADGETVRFTKGAEFTDDNPTAHATAATFFQQSRDGFTFYGNDGLEIGANYAPEELASLNMDGDLSIAGDMSLTNLTVDELVITGGTPGLSYTFPSCRATRTAQQSIGDSTWTAVSLDAQTWDTSAFFAPTSKIFTIPVSLDGLYAVNYSAQFEVDPSGERGVGVALNDATDASTGLLDERLYPTTPTLDMFLGGSCEVRLVAGDTLTLKVFQNSGGNVKVKSTTLGRAFGTALEITRIGD